MPALNYLQRMLLADVFVYRDDVQFQPKDWESRNRIKTAQGAMWISVPVMACPVGTPITEARINKYGRWRDKMLMAIQCAYGRARFYRQYYPQLAEIIRGDFDRLVDLNYATIDFFRAAWGLDQCKFVMASELGCSGDTDEILIAMCKKLGANVYLSGTEGRNYNRPHRWAEAGIRLTYHDYVYPVYKQLHGDFMPWMSALDLLMNCGLEGRRYLDPVYELSAA